MSDGAAILKSFIDPSDLASRISAATGLQGVRCQLIKATMRDMYQVSSDQGRIIAALYPQRPQLADQAAVIQAELHVIEHLHAAGIATARPLPLNNGAHLLPLTLPEGQRYLVLFEFVAHQSAFPRQPSLAHIQAYGALLAQVHSALDTLTATLERPHWTQQQLLDDPLAAFANAIPPQAAIAAELEAAAAVLRPHLAALPQTAPAFGLVHGDVIPSNALLRPDGALCLIDYDLCGLGWRTMDIATFLNEAAYWQMGTAAEDAFLAAYEAHRPLSTQERASLPVLGAARNIWALGNSAAHVNTWGSHIYFSDRVIAGELQRLRQHLAQLNPNI